MFFCNAQNQFLLHIMALFPQARAFFSSFFFFLSAYFYNCSYLGLGIYSNLNANALIIYTY